MDAHFLAFDLGAESGRAMSGRLRSGVLDLAEVCRFPNEPVREHGSLHWDILRLWIDMQRALERLRATCAVSTASASTPGAATTACSAKRGELLGNPYHYRDARTDGVMDAVFAPCRAPASTTSPARSSSASTRSTSSSRRVSGRRALLDAATQFGTIPDILNYWLTGVLRAEYTTATTTQMIDARARNWAMRCCASWTFRRACCRRWSSPAPCSAG